jgi:hypothetical protein
MNSSEYLDLGTMPGATQRLRCSVGVVACNNEATILPLLDAVTDQHLHRVEIAEIIVGDTLPHEYAVENLVRMFVDPAIGMVGAQKTLPALPTHITERTCQAGKA